MSPTITIDLKSEVPVYRQIVDAIRHRLVDCQLVAGDQLPPVRQLALDLGIHFNTVAQAYRVLSDEGWLDLKRKRGATVLDRRKPSPPSKEKQSHSLQRLREFTAHLRAEGIPPKQIAAQLRRLADVIEGE